MNNNVIQWQTTINHIAVGSRGLKFFFFSKKGLSTRSRTQLNFSTLSVLKPTSYESRIKSIAREFVEDEFNTLTALKFKAVFASAPAHELTALISETVSKFNSNPLRGATTWEEIRESVVNEISGDLLPHVVDIFIEYMELLFEIGCKKIEYKNFKATTRDETDDQNKSTAATKDLVDVIKEALSDVSEEVALAYQGKVYIRLANKSSPGRLEKILLTKTKARVKFIINSTTDKSALRQLIQNALDAPGNKIYLDYFKVVVTNKLLSRSSSSSSPFHFLNTIDNDDLIPLPNGNFFYRPMWGIKSENIISKNAKKKSWEEELVEQWLLQQRKNDPQTPK